MARRNRTIPGLCLLLFLGAFPAQAQVVDAFGELPLTLNVGDRIAVEDESGARTSGRLLRLSADALTLHTATGEQRATRESVRSVALRGHALGRGIVIGTAAFGALGVVSTCAREGGADCALIGLRAAPIGIGVGAAIAALVPRMRTVYQRPNGATAVSTGPAATELTGLIESLGPHVNIGDRLRVRDDAGRVATGRLTHLTADVLVLATPAGERRVSHDALRTVDLQRRPIRRVVLVGAGIGALAGAIAACTGSSREECVDAPILAGGLGAGLGLATGAVLRRTTSVYPSGSGRVLLVPSLSRDGVRLLVSRSW